jgi:hypothetical protein
VDQRQIWNDNALYCLLFVGKPVGEVEVSRRLSLDELMCVS